MKLAPWFAATLMLFGQQDKHEEVPLRIQMMVVISASRERFRPLMTYRIEQRPGNSYWYETTITLEGGRYCRIYEHPSLRFVCQWDAKTKIDELTKRLQEALGDGWKRADEKARSKAPRFAHKDEPAKNPVMELSEADGGVRLVVQQPSGGSVMH